MSKWRFWSRGEESEPSTAVPASGPAVATRAKGFTPPPPRTATGIAAGLDTSDPVILQKLTRLQRLERQLEEAELAAQRENPWNERARLIDQAIEGLDEQIRQPVAKVDRQFPDLPSWPLNVESIDPESPSSVLLTAGRYRFPFAEEIDWAERGTTIVKGDLLLESDDLSDLASQAGFDLQVTERLSDALFALATSIRDAALAEHDPPKVSRFDKLLELCPVCGEIRLWNGICLSCVQRNGRLARFETERQRLFAERDAVLAERAAKVEQLPVLRKRYAEAVAALRTSD